MRRLSTPERPKSLWNLGGLTLSQLGHKVFDEIIANNVFGRAAELAFYFVFALFPLILIVVTSFGLFAADRIELQNDLLPPTAFQLLKTVVGELAAHASSGKLTFGIVSALWAVSGGISSMISSVNLAHHVQRNPFLVQSSRHSNRFEFTGFHSASHSLVDSVDRKPFCWLVRNSTGIPSPPRPRLEGESVAGGYLLRSLIVCADLSLWP
jgi:hypothetical protein